MAKKKNYYIRRGNFANQYDLCWTYNSGILPDYWERISRKDAIYYASAEADRRKWNPSMSGYAPQYILPCGYDECDLNPYDNGIRYTIKNRIVEF